jgi:hypothetical protein
VRAIFDQDAHTTETAACSAKAWLSCREPRYQRTSQPKSPQLQPWIQTSSCARDNNVGPGTTARQLDVQPEHTAPRFATRPSAGTCEPQHGFFFFLTPSRYLSPFVSTNRHSHFGSFYYSCPPPQT